MGGNESGFAAVEVDIALVLHWHCIGTALGVSWCCAGALGKPMLRRRPQARGQTRLLDGLLGQLGHLGRTRAAAGLTPMCSTPKAPRAGPPPGQKGKPRLEPPRDRVGLLGESGGPHASAAPGDNRTLGLGRARGEIREPGAAALAEDVSAPRHGRHRVVRPHRRGARPKAGLALAHRGACRRVAPGGGGGVRWTCPGSEMVDLFEMRASRGELVLPPHTPPPAHPHLTHPLHTASPSTFPPHPPHRAIAASLFYSAIAAGLPQFWFGLQSVSARLWRLTLVTYSAASLPTQERRLPLGSGEFAPPRCGLDSHAPTRPHTHASLVPDYVQKLCNYPR